MYRIRDWNKHFENASSRKLKRLDWVAIPNKLDGDGYMTLVDHPNGAAHLGAWIAIVEIASKQTVRGTLPNGNSGIGGLCQRLGRISHLPSTTFEEVLPRLVSIGWVEVIEYKESPTTLAESPTTLAESPTTLAESPTTLAESPTHREGNNRELHNSTHTSGVVINTNTPLPPKVAGVQFAEWPKTSEAVCSRFPTADVVLVGKIIQASLQIHVSIENPKSPAPDDAILADAVKLAAEQSNGQTSAGLFLKKVPAVISNWAKFGRNGSAPQVEPKEWEIIKREDGSEVAVPKNRKEKP